MVDVVYGPGMTAMTPRARAAIARRASNAAGAHDPRPNRQRDRGQARRAALRYEQAAGR